MNQIQTEVLRNPSIAAIAASTSTMNGTAIGSTIIDSPLRQGGTLVEYPVCYSYFRASSTTLPSFGSSPGLRSVTSPRSFVTSRIVATTASTRPAGADSTSQCSVI